MPAHSHSYLDNVTFINCVIEKINPRNKRGIHTALFKRKPWCNGAACCVRGAYLVHRGWVASTCHVPSVFATVVIAVAAAVLLLLPCWVAALLNLL